MSYIGRPLANVSSDETISPDEASYLIRLADRQSYRQFCILAFWDAVSRDAEPYASEVKRLGAQDRKFDDVVGIAGFLQEMAQLAQDGVLGTVDSDGVVVNLGATIGGITGSFLEFVPAAVCRTRLGERFFRLLSLDLIPAVALDEAADLARASVQ